MSHLWLLRKGWQIHEDLLIVYLLIYLLSTRSQGYGPMSLNGQVSYQFNPSPVSAGFLIACSCRWCRCFGFMCTAAISYNPLIHVLVKKHPPPPLSHLFSGLSYSGPERTLNHHSLTSPSHSNPVQTNNLARKHESQIASLLGIICFWHQREKKKIAMTKYFKLS